MFVTVMNKAA